MTTIRPRFITEAERLGLALGGIEIRYQDRHAREKHEDDHRRWVASLPESSRPDYENAFAQSDPLSVFLTHWIRKANGTPDFRYNPFTGSWSLSEFNEILSCACALGYLADGAKPDGNRLYDVAHHFDAGPVFITDRGVFLPIWRHRPVYYDRKTWNIFLEQAEALAEIERHFRCIDQGIPSVLREIPSSRKSTAPAPLRRAIRQPLWGRVLNLIK